VLWLSNCIWILQIQYLPGMLQLTILQQHQIIQINTLLNFLKIVQHQLNIKIEHKNRFLFTIIFDKKNRYIAWTGNFTDRPILKNLDGMSRKYSTRLFNLDIYFLNQHPYGIEI
jgi:hypothetical protein